MINKNIINKLAINENIINKSIKKLKTNQLDQVIPNGKIIHEEMRLAILKKFKYKNIHQVPKVKKIIIHIRFGNRKNTKEIVSNLEKISGQKVVLIKMKKSVSAFGTRKGQLAAAKTTLRNKVMFNFLDRLYVALINWKNFTGFSSKSINLNGKYAQIGIGIPDLTIFTGIYSDQIKGDGCDILIDTTCRLKKEIIDMMQAINIPVY